jgi:hypothetical protein
MTQIQTLPPFVDAAIRRAMVIQPDLRAGVARILVEEGVPEEIECDVLHTSAVPPRLVPGDTVLVWRPAGGERGVVLGRVGPSGTDQGQKVTPPDQIELEAKQCITLRVGDGSITIREDGKILIKGKDLVSHAQRMNRIKGGAVSIN